MNKIEELLESIEESLDEIIEATERDFSYSTASLPVDLDTDLDQPLKDSPPGL